MAQLELTEDTYRDLKKLYDNAVKEGKQYIKFGDFEMTTHYAKYVLEYAAEQLNITDDETNQDSSLGDIHA